MFLLCAQTQQHSPPRFSRSQMQFINITMIKKQCWWAKTACVQPPWVHGHKQSNTNVIPWPWIDAMQKPSKTVLVNSRPSGTNPTAQKLWFDPFRLHYHKLNCLQPWHHCMTHKMLMTNFLLICLVEIYTTTEERKNKGGFLELKSVLTRVYGNKPGQSNNLTIWCMALSPVPGNKVWNISSKKITFSLGELSI